MFTEIYLTPFLFNRTLFSRKTHQRKEAHKITKSCKIFNHKSEYLTDGYFNVEQ